MLPRCHCFLLKAAESFETTVVGENRRELRMRWYELYRLLALCVAACAVHGANDDGTCLSHLSGQHAAPCKGVAGGDSARGESCELGFEVGAMIGCMHRAAGAGSMSSQAVAATMGTTCGSGVVPDDGGSCAAGFLVAVRIALLHSASAETATAAAVTAAAAAAAASADATDAQSALELDAMLRQYAGSAGGSAGPGW